MIPESIFDEIKKACRFHDGYDYDAIKNNSDLMYERVIQELQGISYVISADGIVSEEELKVLVPWLVKYQYLKSIWPLSIIFNHMKKVKAIEDLTETWKADLCKYLNEISAMNTVIKLKFDVIPEEKLKNLNIVLTGNFDCGSRKNVITTLRNAGYKVLEKNSITIDTDCLLVGNCGSKAWRFSGFGRKIEAAIQQRAQKKRPLIIQEESIACLSV